MTKIFEVWITPKGTLYTNKNPEYIPCKNIKKIKLIRVDEYLEYKHNVIRLRERLREYFSTIFYKGEIEGAKGLTLGVLSRLDSEFKKLEGEKDE